MRSWARALLTFVRIIKSQRNWASNAILATWLAADGVRFLIFARDIRAPLVDAMAGAALLMAAIFALQREQPKQEKLGVSAILVPIAATLTPIAFGWFLPFRDPSTAKVTVQGAAVGLMAAGLLYLGRNISIFPQYRSLVVNGPYALVRHPIYASYLIFDGVQALDLESWVGGGIWLLEACLLIWRVDIEEQFLAASEPGYLMYCERVRWRFIPGII